jgi:hypothetical protein
MSIIIDQVVENRRSYSPLNYQLFRCVARSYLSDLAKQIRAAPKSPVLPGKRRAKETRYFFKHAQAMAQIAIEIEGQVGDDVVAVLFVDADGSGSAGRGLWEDKYRSIIDGFAQEGFIRGVPMVPRPVSEAWLVCALKGDAYLNCHLLEEESGRPGAVDNLKRVLEQLIEEEANAEALCRLLSGGRIVIDRIQMPSFDEFRSRLESVI